MSTAHASLLDAARDALSDNGKPIRVGSYLGQSEYEMESGSAELEWEQESDEMPEEFTVDVDFHVGDSLLFKDHVPMTVVVSLSDVEVVDSYEGVHLMQAVATW